MYSNTEVPDDDPRKVHLRAAFARRGGGDELFELAVPIAIHGDGVPVGKVSMDATSWYGMLGRNLSTVDQNILLHGHITRCATPQTARQM